MNYLIALFLVFCIPFSVKAVEETSATELIPVKEGDIVQYPLDAQPVEVEAQLNGLWHICTLMPGDSFNVTDIINYDHYADERTGIEVQKIEGTPGNHQICYKGSLIDVRGTHEIEKTKEGVPQIVNKIHSPFIFQGVPEDILLRKNLPSTLENLGEETVLFKKGDIITYPLDAQPIEVESTMYTLDDLNFRCTAAPGDSFEVVWPTSYVDFYGVSNNSISLKKEGGTPGNQNICPKGSFTGIEIANCVLKRTEEGRPEGLLCNHSLKTLFNPQEKTEE